MKSILITQDFPPESGGIARLYGELCRNMPAGSVSVSTVTETGDHPVPQNVVITRMPWSRRDARRFPVILRWARALDTRDTNILQIGNIRPTGYIGALLEKRRGIPYVIYVHGKDLLKEIRKSRSSLRGRWTARQILGNAAAIIANSQHSARLAKELLSFLGREVPVHVVHPGTDPAFFRPDPAGARKARERLGFSDPFLLSVTRLMRRKGIDTTLRAIRDMPHLHYVIAGEGEDRARLDGLVRELGIASRVHFLGAVPDAELPGLYSACDIFVLPVREELEDDEVEGFGIVYCEAGGCGAAVIAGASGGTADAVRDGETGMLVPPNDPVALGAAISRLLTDPEERKRLGANGRKAVEEYYNWQRAGREAWQIIETAARARPSR